MEKSIYGDNGFFWFWGIVEDRMDPLNLGRVRVRCFGNVHSEDKTQVPTNSLPWAHVIMPATSASISGIGQSPTGLVEGSLVFGFFLDGMNKQMPCVIGSLHSIPQSLANSALGFNDPRKDTSEFPGGPYPLFVDEPDTNRLARNENISNTIVQTKNNDVDPEASEPSSPYDAKYPFNHVYQTESGHVVEFDDTPGAERIHEYHRSGTFREIGPDGTLVEKTKGNHHIIDEGDNYEHITGDKNLIVDGDATVTLTQGSLTLVVSNGTVEIQASTINITGDVNVTGTITATTDVVAGLISLSRHTHAGVTSGQSVTAPPTPG